MVFTEPHKELQSGELTDLEFLILGLFDLNEMIHTCTGNSENGKKSRSSSLLSLDFLKL